MKKLIITGLLVILTGLLFSQGNLSGDTLKFKKNINNPRGRIFRCRMSGDTLFLNNDTLFMSKSADPQPYEFEVAQDDENNWQIPFYLKNSSIIYYNGSALRPSQWAGAGNSILTVNLYVRKHDHLIIIH